MKNKFTLLIIVSILALIALSGIQAYLITNTYEHKKAAFRDEVSSLISDIDDEEELDSLYVDAWGTRLSDHIADYKNTRISKRELMARAKDDADSLNIPYTHYYNMYLDALNIDYELTYYKELKGIVIYEKRVLDTLYAYKKASPFVLFGKRVDDESIVLSSSRWYDGREYISTTGENVVTQAYDLEVSTTDKVVVTNWKRVILGRMAALLIGSVFLFLFVIGLLYYSIKNLITQKKIAEVKTDFINNITHELKTPLATLSIASKSLRTDAIKGNPTAFESTLGIVDRQNNRLQKLIDQVLTNSLSAKELVLNKEQVVDNTFFNHLIADFKLAHQHSTVTITNNVCTPEVWLRLDKFHVTTALQNILDNAVKYGKEQIDITITTAVKNGNYCIEIKDNGIGISGKDQKTIFDKFYRVNDGNVHDVKGLGLGLYFTHQIITAHGGTISVESTINEGTTFTIKIPTN